MKTKYRCVECNHIFDEGEQAVWYESRGEFWGSPCSERMTGCPVCKGDYDEVVQCKECGEWVWNDEVDYDGLCEGCQEKR